MNKKDFLSCKFINEYMKFYTYHDFCDNRKLIKSYFNKMTDNEKLFYKWYVYANIHMKLTYKNKIWDYLNGYDNEKTLLGSLKFYKSL